MVRAIVGSIIEVGRGKQSPEWIAELIANGTRGDAGESQWLPQVIGTRKFPILHNGKLAFATIHAPPPHGINTLVVRIFPGCDVNITYSSYDRAS